MSISNGDVRKDYVLSTLANYFGLAPNDGVVTSLVNDAKLNNFLDDGNALILSGYTELEGGAGGEDGGGSGGPGGQIVRIHLDNAAHVGLTENKVGYFFSEKYRICVVLCKA